MLLVIKTPHPCLCFVFCLHFLPGIHFFRLHVVEFISFFLFPEFCIMLRKSSKGTILDFVEFAQTANQPLKIRA